MIKGNLTKCAVTLLLASSLMACGNSQVSQPKTNDTNQQSQSKNDNASATSSQNQDDVKLPTSWNKQDMDVKSNENIVYALSLIGKNGMDTNNAKHVNFADVTKAPFKYIGDVQTFTGTVAIAQEYAPGGKESKIYTMNNGPVGEIVMMDSDAKTMTPVDYILIGDLKGINVQDNVRIYGYVLGTVQVDNKLGGKTDQVFIIGTKVEKLQ